MRVQVGLVSSMIQLSLPLGWPCLTENKARAKGRCVQLQIQDGHLHGDAVS